MILDWCKALKLLYDQTLLLVFVCCSDEYLRLARIFPEYMACNTTFVVTKEQMNPFLIADIDGNNKVFNTMRCFMLSKREQAYH